MGTGDITLDDESACAVDDGACAACEKVGVGGERAPEDRCGM